MKINCAIASPVLLLCLVVPSRGWAETPDQPKESAECAPANRPAGYISDIKFPQGGRRIKVYDPDLQETGDHPPVCLSKSADDSMLWARSSHKKFRLKISPQKDADKCGQHPFQIDPSSLPEYGFLSGPLRHDVPIDCVYNVQFWKEDEQPSDPHIRVAP